MKKKLFQQTFPIMTHEISKNSIDIDNIDDICRYFSERINENPIARHIGIFDHYAHTASLADGEICGTIKAAKVVLFCFGKKLTDPDVLSVRPRGIGLCETYKSFVISFMEAPNAAMTQTMVQWVEQLDSSNIKGLK